MTRKSTYTIQAGYDTEEEEWSFKDWLWRILLITFVVGIITVGIAAMSLIIVRHNSLRRWLGHRTSKTVITKFN